MNKYIASRDFYKQTAAIAIPLAIQSMLSSCMSIVDTMMVSWIGMVSPVGTASQVGLMSVIIAFGVISGTGIFSSQFFGAKDYGSFKKSFGLSLVLTSISAMFFFFLCLFFSEELIRFYMDDPTVLEYGTQYLDILKYSFVPTALTFAFTFAYRSTHNTKVPLFISTIAMATNMILNYCLIFGVAFFPEMGVRGAAIATVIAQWTGLAGLAIHAIRTKQPFIGTFTEMFKISRDFARPILKKTAFLVINEGFFTFGTTLFIKAFSELGTASMDAYYVGSKISEIFTFVVNGISSATAVIIGSSLGRKDIDEARRQGDYFLFMAGVLACIFAVVIFTMAKPLVFIFGIEDPVIFNNSVLIVRVFALKIALRLFTVIIFSSLRAGGDSLISLSSTAESCG